MQRSPLGATAAAEQMYVAGYESYAIDASTDVCVRLPDGTSQTTQISCDVRGLRRAVRGASNMEIYCDMAIVSLGPQDSSTNSFNLSSSLRQTERSKSILGTSFP